ncbi:hypothetical protein AZE42_05367 [Rhizopogon vesiculosus]|uniref:Ketoreductase (KR) domain-containing protein n=1 Tax=Rhizopogon vesiculosus TaxID=180088 RepID=A0A1J8QL20_9AGAM|nr:hypothetical protein AZE42_05367 [Rhizopogon vesiculosus]
MKINPLALIPIGIDRSTLTASVDVDDNSILERIGNFLVSQLQIEYESKRQKIHGQDGTVALAYSKGAWPFNHPLSDDANILKYWTDFLDHDNADILAARDVGANDFPKTIVDAAVKQYGKINHIVNNDDTFDIIMKIHVCAPFRLIRTATPYFRVKSNIPENRSIINVSSTSDLHGDVGQANYAAAKSAVVGLTKTIAKEWGPFGVRANTIAYGLVHTRVTIEIDIKKVALGIPGALKSAPKSINTLPDIPRQKSANADEVAAGMLL